jgi:hypothetical protein
MGRIKAPAPFFHGVCFLFPRSLARAALDLDVVAAHRLDEAIASSSGAGTLLCVSFYRHEAAGAL